MVACDPNAGGNTGGNNSGTIVLPNIAGTWYREGDWSRPASVGQSGERLTFTNELKPPMSSRGRFLGPREVVAEDWEGGLRGTLSNDGRRISWANGSTWQR